MNGIKDGPSGRYPPWIPLAFYAALICFSSLHPFSGWRSLGDWSPQFITAPLPPFITRTDLSTNFLVYVPLGYLLALVLARPRRRGRAVLLATLAGMSLSLALESLQQLSPGRIASNLDMFVNTLGGLTGAVLFLHHRRWQRAGRWFRRWRNDWFLPGNAVNLGIGLLVLWCVAQFSLLPVAGAGWLDLHLRPLDTPPGGLDKLNLAWFAAVFLEIAVLGAFAACLLRPGRYVSAMVLLFLLAFAGKLLAATILLKLRVVGGVLSLETLAAFLLAFWLLLNPHVSRRRLIFATLLLFLILAVRLALADYLFLPRVSLLNIMGLAKAIAALWPFMALGALSILAWSRPPANIAKVSP
jgi:VanZ family protein